MEQQALSSLVAQRSPAPAGDSVPWRTLLVMVLGASALILFPGDLRHSVHLALQGVCAQRPSHSFVLGGQPLPVDARMTGIYLGAVTSLTWFLLVWRGARSGRLTRATWRLVAVMVGVMAVDGTNALAMDLALTTPYATTNGTRVVTGLLSGVAIGATLSHVATMTLSARPRGGWPASAASTMVMPLLVGAALCGLAMSGLATLALPVTWLLAGAVLAVLWTMTSVLTALALGRSWGFTSARQRDETLALGLAAAWLLVLALAGGRALLEQIAGPIRLS